ncbi:hypothetical protein KM043_002171 [Ampulex compressa]|nr:hypothetical protein KM043_002171 [Ampulex compressa]
MKHDERSASSGKRGHEVESQEGETGIDLIMEQGSPVVGTEELVLLEMQSAPVAEQTPCRLVVSPRSCRRFTHFSSRPKPSRGKHEGARLAPLPRPESYLSRPGSRRQARRPSSPPSAFPRF